MKLQSQNDHHAPTARNSNANRSARPEPGSKLAHALAHAALGFRVFPLVENGKEPAIRGWPKRATTNPERIKSWWRSRETEEERDHNIAILATGYAILDEDNKTVSGQMAREFLELQYGSLPRTRVTRTPTGGRHFFFQPAAPVRNSKGKIDDGLDVRGENGYVVAPGSTIDGRAYEWENEAEIANCPDWLEELMHAAAPAYTKQPQVPLTEYDTSAAITRAVDYLDNHAPFAVEGAGGDDTTVRVAARLKDLGISEETAIELLLDHWDERCSPPWGPDGIEEKVKNAYRYLRMNPPGAASPEADFGPPTTEAEPIPTTKIRATPYTWTEPAAIPPRQWLYDRHLIRKFVSATIAPGGVGKTSLAIVELLAFVTGRPLLNDRTPAPGKAWFWNGEDPRDEVERRIQAACLHYGITREELEGRLFVDTGRETPIVIAREETNKLVIARPVTEAIIATIRENKIDLVKIDPFISSHEVPENENTKIQAVADEWARVADKANCAVELIHHSRKTGGGELTVEDSRGGSALTDKARSVRLLNKMTKEEGAKAGVDEHRLYFRVDKGKQNLAPPSENAVWCRLENVDLGNSSFDPGTDDPLDADIIPSDHVGVVVSWTWPDAFDGITDEDLLKAQESVDNGNWRENVQANAWVGIPIARALGLDLQKSDHKAKVKQLIKGWIEEGAFNITKDTDENRSKRKFVTVGKWAKTDIST